MTQYQLSLNIKQGYGDGVFVGQVAEFPSVIVQSNSVEGVVKEATIATEGYFKAFPEEKIKMQNFIKKETLLLTIE